MIKGLAWILAEVITNRVKFARNRDFIMKIICPHCKTKNNIEYAENIRCQCCQKSFKDYTYNIKAISKPIIAGASAILVAGGLIGYSVENYLDQIRYPIEFEYAIVTQCANPKGSGYLREKELQTHIQICSCALEKTLNEVGYKEVIDQEFSLSFRNNLGKCR